MTKKGVNEEVRKRWREQIERRHRERDELQQRLDDSQQVRQPNPYVEVPLRVLIFVLWFTGISAMSELSQANRLSQLADYVQFDYNGETTGLIEHARKYQTQRSSRPGGGLSNRMIDRFSISYSYTVNGVRYVSSKFDHNFRGDDVSRKQATYRKGQTVTVYYELSNPRLAVLEKSLGWGWLEKILIALALPIASLAFWFASRWYVSSWWEFGFVLVFNLVFSFMAIHSVLHRHSIV